MPSRKASVKPLSRKKKRRENKIKEDEEKNGQGQLKEGEGKGEQVLGSSKVDRARQAPLKQAPELIGGGESRSLWVDSGFSFSFSLDFNTFPTIGIPSRVDAQCKVQVQVHLKPTMVTFSRRCRIPVDPRSRRSSGDFLDRPDRRQSSLRSTTPGIPILGGCLLRFKWSPAINLRQVQALP